MQLVERTTNQQTALDQLVVLQLEAIIESETKLRQRYSSLLTSSTAAEWRTWTAEMQHLRVRADRLERMLGALDGSYALPTPIEEPSYTAA